MPINSTIYRTDQSNFYNISQNIGIVILFVLNSLIICNCVLTVTFSYFKITKKRISRASSNVFKVLFTKQIYSGRRQRHST